MPLLMDTADAARALALSPRQLRRLVKDRELKAVYVGRAVRFSPIDLAEFVERRRSDDE